METTIENVSPPQVAAVAGVIADSRDKGDMSQTLEVMVSRLRDLLGADGVTVELEQDGSLVCCYASGHARRWLGRLPSPYVSKNYLPPVINLVALLVAAFAIDPLNPGWELRMDETSPAHSSVRNLDATLLLVIVGQRE